jgi:Super-infection exclusion protein B
MNFTRVLEWLGKPALVLGAVLLFCGMTLWLVHYPWFAPAKKIVDPYLGWMLMASLASSSLLVMYAVTQAVTAISRKASRRNLEKARRRHLQNLTEPEKVVLREYLHCGTKTASWDMQDGVVHGLEAYRILFRSSTIGNVFSGFPYNMHDDVWDYLKEHPELIR